MMIRTLHWTVPHYWIWGLPFYMLYSTRSSQFLYERPNQSFPRNFLCRLLSPARGIQAVSKIIESYLAWKLPLDKYGLRPDHPFEEDYASWLFSPKISSPRLTKERLHSKKHQDGGFQREELNLKTIPSWKLML
ncbi:unnamed protein product [Camellia sinensis]